jgi:hypothetical protein
MEIWWLIAKWLVILREMISRKLQAMYHRLVQEPNIAFPALNVCIRERDNLEENSCVFRYICYYHVIQKVHQLV